MSNLKFETSPLLVKKDHVFCTVCMICEPINAGDGTPINSFLEALISAKRRHPKKYHDNPFLNKKPTPTKKDR